MYEDLVKRLNGAAGGPEGIRMCLEAAAAITDLLVENQSLRNAADVSPVRHGRWIIGEPDIIGAPIHCSECGWGSDHAYQKDWMKYPGHKFCGACGALMNGGKDDGRIY